MELSDISFGDTKVPWNSMEYYMEFHGTKLYLIWRYQSSMEFHGIFHEIPWNIPWNSMQYLCHLKWRPPNSMESHGTRWFFIYSTPEFHGIPWNIPCKSRVTWYWIKWQSQNSMEFHGTKWYFIWRHQSSVEYSMEFHGTPVSFEMAPS